MKTDPPFGGSSEVPNNAVMPLKIGKPVMNVSGKNPIKHDRDDGCCKDAGDLLNTLPKPKGAKAQGR